MKQSEEVNQHFERYGKRSNLHTSTISNFRFRASPISRSSAFLSLAAPDFNVFVEIGGILISRAGSFIGVRRWRKPTITVRFPLGSKAGPTLRAKPIFGIRLISASIPITFQTKRCRMMRRRIGPRFWRPHLKRRWIRLNASL
jgi:hypothetical protein